MDLSSNPTLLVHAVKVIWRCEATGTM